MRSWHSGKFAYVSEGKACTEMPLPLEFRKVADWLDGWKCPFAVSWSCIL